MLKKIPYNQIFYDPTRQRWFYTKLIFAVFMLGFVAVLSVFFLNLFRIPALPILNIGQPTPEYRKAPLIPRSDIKESQILPENLVPPISQTTPSSPSNVGKSRVIAFYVNWDDTSLTSLKTNINNIDELMPEWLHIAGTDGSIQIDDEARQNLTLETIRAARNDLPIVPLINNFNNDLQDWDGKTTAELLSNKEARAKLIDNLKNFVTSNGFAGIHIDFESLPDSSQPQLIFFMQELWNVFHPAGLEVSQSIPLDDDAFNARALSQSTDFIVFMGYDENAPGGTNGPIASQPWFTSSLIKRLAQVPPEKTVLALGSYGYDWTGETSEGIDITYQEAIQASRDSDGKIALNPASLNPTFDYLGDEDKTHHIWFLDAVTVFNQITAGQKYHPLGYALWRLGSEDPGVWQVFADREHPNQNTAEALRNIEYGYDIDYEGEGDVLRVVDEPQTGERTLIYNPSKSLITDETIVKYPSAYTIARWGGNDKKKIALTFDDGPDPIYTPQILQILKQYRVPAAFFVVGANANLHPNLLKRIFSEGHEIGNHTYTHPNITAVSQEEFDIELNTTQRLIESFLGRSTLLFRPPYAEDVEPETPEQVKPLILTGDLGYYTIGIQIDPKDWSSPGVDTIVQKVIDGAQDEEGNVVLLHDGGGDRKETVEALPAIIRGLRLRGYTLVSIADLLNLKRDDVMPPVPINKQIVTRLEGIGFFLIAGLSFFVYWMFLIGILLGVVRFLFVGTLAIIQWKQVRRCGSLGKTEPYHPKVSVIIPAYNEESVIAQTVRALLHSEYANMHIVVIDDGSTDNTFATLEQAFRNEPKVSVRRQENKGKAAALNEGIRLVDAEIVITLDADTVFRRDTISKLVCHFSDPKVGAVAGNVKVGNRINLLTAWQALEYITSQNLDRRAFSLLNCITVVPGSVGAWRRQAVIEAGGFSNRTLAEDTDLTFEILLGGGRVVYDDTALAYTEAPDKIKNFLLQRFRWMYGTLQAVWKHKGIFMRLKGGSLGLFAIPNILIFQVFFPFISPLIDLALIFSLVWISWERYHHPESYSVWVQLQPVLFYYLFFLIVDILTAATAFALEYREQWLLLLWLPFQRFLYRQLMYYTAVKVIVVALHGKLLGWGKFERKATVRVIE
jgi:cellulose synthase/poly-beta-1,6-N-acetylglucosamine synthase-like glycosyltransferase/peptidoglycan/xylan/chitin deacetylase (PgdA/CDA1 family)/spore germination protein YaaH